jgi:hypothetical protein
VCKKTPKGLPSCPETVLLILRPSVHLIYETIRTIAKFLEAMSDTKGTDPAWKDEGGTRETEEGKRRRTEEGRN